MPFQRYVHLLGCAKECVVEWHLCCGYLGFILYICLLLQGECCYRVNDCDVIRLLQRPLMYDKCGLRVILLVLSHLGLSSVLCRSEGIKWNKGYNSNRFYEFQIPDLQSYLSHRVLQIHSKKNKCAGCVVDFDWHQWQPGQVQWGDMVSTYIFDSCAADM